MDMLYISRLKGSWWKTGKGEKSVKSYTEASAATTQESEMKKSTRCCCCEGFSFAFAGKFLQSLKDF